MQKYKRIMILLAFSLLVVNLIACKDNDGSSAPLSKSFLRKAKEGDTFLLGRYEQDNDLENGPEDIEWIVLEKGNEYIMAISKYALECMSFQESETWEKTDWETCTVRQWLNSDFYSNAFSLEEQEFVCPVELENPDSFYFDIEGGNNTIDYVSLLDKETIIYLYEDIEFQIVKFTYTPDGSAMELTMSKPYEYEPLVARYTDYANQKFLQTLLEYQDYEEDFKNVYGQNCCAWWLRSRGDQDYGTLQVGYDGCIMSVPSAARHGIRPVIYIGVDAG